MCVCVCVFRVSPKFPKLSEANLLRCNKHDVYFLACFESRIKKRNHVEKKQKRGKRTEDREQERERERERERWRGEQEATGLVVGAKGRSSQGDENFEIKR